VTLTQAGTHLNMRVGLFARIERQHELSVPADRFHSNAELSRSRKYTADWFGHGKAILIPNLPQFTANEQARREASE
jgi:hypothetical protein